MKSFIRIFIAASLLSLGSTTASACILPPYSRVEKASDVIIEGRYFHDPADEESGHIEPARYQKGERRDRYQVRWSIERHEDQCATQMPANGNYERFYLVRREGGFFVMIGRVWAQDPDDPEDTDE